MRLKQWQHEILDLLGALGFVFLGIFTFAAFQIEATILGFITLLIMLLYFFVSIILTIEGGN